MNQEASLLKQIKSVVLYTIILFVPLFFLPFTQEFFVTNKMYLLFFGALILLLLSTCEFLLTKKIVWEKKPYDNAVIFFFIASIASVIFSSPNKIQALLNPNFGIMTFFSYVVLYFYISREKNSNIKYTLVYIAAIVTGLIALFYFFNPLQNVKVTEMLQFFKNPYFSLQGSMLDALIFLGFSGVLAFSHLFTKKTQNQILTLTTLIVSLVGATTIIITFIKIKDLLIITPLNLSWYAAVETLKSPLTGLFGVGIDNFSSMFTKVKDIGYNSSPLWQVGSFNVSGSMILHVFTEMGVIGCISFIVLLLHLVKHVLTLRSSKSGKYEALPVLYVILTTLLLPPSLIVFFVLFVLLTDEKNNVSEKNTFSVDSILPLYAAILVLSFLFLIGMGYLGGRSYAAEVYFKRSLDGFAQNNIKTVYDNMRSAVITNQYIERYRSNFSQTNLLIANNVANKAQTNNTDKSGTNTSTLSDQDRQTISQALQAAIEEAKAVVTLNPQKAANWENLANIYRNIINVAQGADSWTVSAYQRAIILDPQNPNYRVALGGILYTFKNYDEAIKLFEQAISIKPDWANSYYNLAWASFQKQDYQNAYLAMQSTVSLLDPKKDAADYQKATSDLEEFKKKLPANETTTATQAAQTKPSQLSVPTPPVQSLEPKIKLPKEASPEAK